MYIKAMQGCWLTQTADVDSAQREFIKEKYVATMLQAEEWKEVTESERAKIIEQASMFDLRNLNFSLVEKVDRLNKELPYKINEAHLTANQALAMQQYFPSWESCWGRKVYAGFKFRYNGALMEVVTPHVISENLVPEVPANKEEKEVQPSVQPSVKTSAKPMKISAAPAVQSNVQTDIMSEPQKPQYYQLVVPSQLEPQEEGDPVGKDGEDGASFIDQTKENTNPLKQ